jgi:hypothetical protein
MGRPQAFYGFTNLSQVTFEENSTYAMIFPQEYDNTAITSFDVPASVTGISMSAFYRCNSLESITFNSEIPPSINVRSISVFEPLYLPGVTEILVPVGSVDAYREAFGENFKEAFPYAIIKDADNSATLSPTPTPPAPLTVHPTSSTVLVDGENITFDAYNIEGNNYFKLRDLAYTLSGSEKQFEVVWDSAASAIALISGKAYTLVGDEMVGKGDGAKQASPTKSKITLDGDDISLTAYNIADNNYFKLRDIGAAFDFGITWDAERNTIVIDTSIGYTPE